MIDESNGHVRGVEEANDWDADQRSGMGGRAYAPKILPFFMAAVFLFLGTAILSAEQGWLVVSAVNILNTKVKIQGVEIAVVPTGSALTDHFGSARLKLPPDAVPGSWITLAAEKAGWELMYPVEGKTPVPSFSNESNNQVLVGLVKKGDKAALKLSASIEAITQGVTLLMGPNTAGQTSENQDQQRQRALSLEASRLGFQPNELDAAIRAFGKTAASDFDRGLAFLYEGDYAQATPLLERVAAQRRENADLGSVASNRFAGAPAAKAWLVPVAAAGSNDAYGAAHLLALTNLLYADLFSCESLYLQRQYRAAIQPVREANKIRPNDPLIVSWLGIVLFSAGDNTQAEAALRSAVAIAERSPKPNSSMLAMSWSNLANLLYNQRKYENAESLDKQAVELDERTPGQPTPEMAIRRSNYGVLLETEGVLARQRNRPDEAEIDFRRAREQYDKALEIDQKTVGDKHQDYARVLNNLGQLERRERNDEEAERHFRRALEIDEAALGKQHPEVATVLNNLGALLSDHGRGREALQFYQRALEIDERLGPTYPNVVRDLNNLSSQLYLDGDYAGAEERLRRAIDIYQKNFGPDGPEMKMMRQSLDQLVQKRKKQ